MKTYEKTKELGTVRGDTGGALRSANNKCELS